MKEPDDRIFASLFNAAVEKCFGHLPGRALTETESKLMHTQIFTETGLTIGWRSLKNFSFYLLNLESAKPENPSIATLDTLARYIMGAPHTDEVRRKNEESHHPYWFSYRSRQIGARETPTAIEESPKKQPARKLWLVVTIVLLVLTLSSIWIMKSHTTPFVESFSNTKDIVLRQRGWFLLDADSNYWRERNKFSGGLALFTLPGDNWPDTHTAPRIRNLLCRPLPTSCFTTEVQFLDFIPKAEWQQAGILLLQDTSLSSPSLRVSLAYNDLFGGYHRPKEIITQVVYSSGTDNKPEEIAHIPVLTLDSTNRIPILYQNLKYSSIRIEKKDHHYRVLVAGSAFPNSAYKEVVVKEIEFEPRYIALFAIKGNSPASPVIPVHINKFVLTPCS